MSDYRLSSCPTCGSLGPLGERSALASLGAPASKVSDVHCPECKAQFACDCSTCRARGAVEYARARRDGFAKAALQGMLAGGHDGTESVLVALEATDLLIAALDGDT